MCGITGASRRTTAPGHCPQPVRLDPELDAAGEQDLHADADAEHGPARRHPVGDDLLPADLAQPRHARLERADPGHHQTVGGIAAAAGSAVTSTSAPTRCSARWAERRLPEP